MPMHGKMSPEVIHRIKHELSVNRIELEMQNEELLRTQSELDAARARYFDLYELAPVGYCTIGEQGLILEVNLTLGMLLGVPQRLLVGQPVYRYIDEADRDIYYLLMRKIADKGEAQSAELRLMKNDGGLFWAAVTANSVQDAACASMHRIVFNDISARKSAEGLLVEKQRQLQGMVDSAMDAIITVDERYRVVQYNPAAEAMFGIPSSEAIGGALERFFPRRLRLQVQGEIQKLSSIALGTGMPGKIVGQRCGGAEFPIEITASRVEVNGKQLFTAIMRDQTQRVKDDTALLALQEGLHELVAHQSRIREDERIRIAREIHDELGSLLTGIRAQLSVAMHMEQLAGQAPNRCLADAGALLDAAVDTMCRVITDLRPSVLDQLGVWAALEWYAGRTETQTGLACYVHIDECAMETVVDAERTTALFRIFQESLTNVVRHAGATRVDVHVTYVEGSIVMEIEDDGCGIDAVRATDHTSWGIAGMSERASYFGGGIEISNLSPGTLVSLRLPLDKLDV